MPEHTVMESLTPEWWTCIFSVLAILFLLLLLPKYSDWANRPSYPKALAILLFLNLAIENMYALYLGSWSIENNLPLHLCGISTMMAISVLWRFKASIAQVLFYWGITGGIHALLTPEFDLGTRGFFYFSYFIGHGGLLLACLYPIVHHGFKPEKHSWLKVFGVTQLVAILIGIFNWKMGSNYMYLNHPPIAKSLLILGDWPWYILVFEALAIVHFFVLYKLSRVWK